MGSYPPHTVTIRPATQRTRQINRPRLAVECATCKVSFDLPWDHSPDTESLAFYQAVHNDELDPLLPFKRQRAESAARIEAAAPIWISIDHSMSGFTEGRLYEVERRGVTQAGTGYQVTDDNGYARFVPDGACSKATHPNQQNDMTICEECRADISPFDDGEPGRHDTTCSWYAWGADEEGKPTWVVLTRGGDGGWAEDEVLPIIAWAYQGLPVILTREGAAEYQTLALCPGTWRPWRLADETVTVELTEWDTDSWMQNRTPPTPLGRRFEHAVRAAQYKDSL